MLTKKVNWANNGFPCETAKAWKRHGGHTAGLTKDQRDLQTSRCKLSVLIESE